MDVLDTDHLTADAVETVGAEIFLALMTVGKGTFPWLTKLGRNKR